MATTTPMKPAVPVRPVSVFENTFGFPLFRRFSRELDAMFDRFGLEHPMFEEVTPVWNPEVEIFTKDNTLFVRMDVPGVNKDEIAIDVGDDHLVLRGERKAEKKEEKDGFYKTERTYGSFYRTVPLPEGVNLELAKATLDNGVLQVTMPIAKVETKARKLEIATPTPTTPTVKAA